MAPRNALWSAACIDIMHTPRLDTVTCTFPSQPRNLQRMHNLELVATSRACAIRPYEHSKTDVEVGADGDGMAVSFQTARDIYQALKREEASNIVALPKDVPSQAVSVAQPQQQPPQQQASASNGSGSAANMPPPAGSQHSQVQQRKGWANPADVVASKIAEAAAAATSAASPLASAAEILYAGLAASLPIGPPSLGANNRASIALLAPPLDGTERVTSVAIAAIAAAEFKQQAAYEKKRAGRALASASTAAMSVATPTCPSEW